jgi:hypothetical protein
MTRALLAVLGVMLCSCGQDECSQARTTLKSCGVPESALGAATQCGSAPTTGQSTTSCLISPD